MNSGRSKRFDFGVSATNKSAKGGNNDNDWMSVGDDRRIDLSNSNASGSDCDIVKVGDDLYDLISQSDNFDVYSMASVPEFSVTTPKRGTDKMFSGL